LCKTGKPYYVRFCPTLKNRSLPAQSGTQAFPAQLVKIESGFLVEKKLAVE
jgi:hypothetical protein